MTIARTTGIGSLPHHNVDAALEFSFHMGIPFLPQIPIRNPWEYMIAQALEGIPGLQVEKDGAVTVDGDVWQAQAHHLDRKLAQAFMRASADPLAFEGFEPSASISGSWQPFLWELEERGIKTAKVQIAGPLTSQWVLRLKEGDSLQKLPGLTAQIYRLVVARALAMCRRLSQLGIQPIVYLDEPGLYGLSLENPTHLLGLQELKLMVQTLRKEGADVGLHCCSNTNWSAVFGLGINILSLDAALSLDHVLSRAHLPQLDEFLAQGGRLSLGVIPTGRGFAAAGTASEIFGTLMASFGKVWRQEPGKVRAVLSNALFTPACGLALHSVDEAEEILDRLLEFAQNYAVSSGRN